MLSVSQQCPIFQHGKVTQPQEHVRPKKHTQQGITHRNGHIHVSKSYKVGYSQGDVSNAAYGGHGPAVMKDTVRQDDIVVVISQTQAMEGRHPHHLGHFRILVEVFMKLFHQLGSAVAHQFIANPHSSSPCSLHLELLREGVLEAMTLHHLPEVDKTHFEEGGI